MPAGRPRVQTPKGTLPHVPVSNEIHVQMKIYRATHKNMTLEDIANEAIAQWLEKQALK